MSLFPVIVAIRLCAHISNIVRERVREIMLESRQCSAGKEIYKYCAQTLGMDRAFNCSHCGAWWVWKWRRESEGKQENKRRLSSIIPPSASFSGSRSSDAEMSSYHWLLIIISTHDRIDSPSVLSLALAIVQQAQSGAEGHFACIAVRYGICIAGTSCSL